MAEQEVEIRKRPLSDSVWVDRLDRVFDRLGDRCNPILVKEARQALKSRHFVWTFAVLLLGAWVWSVVGITLMMPGIYYVPGGRAMLLGYYWVLAVPMMMVAPMAAHRSLVSEREDGTFEVLSISTLTSYQIILGKLASTVLQLVIYFTALVPCVAFTYILRGIDLPSVALVVTTTFLTAIFLVVVGLFMATLATTRAMQSVMMVLLLLFVLAAEYVHGAFVTQLLSIGIRSDDLELLMLIVALMSFYLTISVFLILASASAISPASENKSTRLRIMMLVVQMLSVFWVSYLAFYIQDQGVAYSRSLFRSYVPNIQLVIVAVVFLGAFYWIGMGGLMLGEPTQLSARVRRGLPRSFVGRVFLTWLNPGPGTGMVLAIIGFVSVIGYAFALEELFGPVSRLNAGSMKNLSVTILGYMMLFMGLAHLLISAIRTKGEVSPFISLVMTMLMMSLGCIVPYSAGLYFNNYRAFDWDYSQITNWAWTLALFMRNSEPASISVTVMILGLASVALNVWYVGRDVMIRRISTPDRVLQELAALHPTAGDDATIDPLA